MINKKTTVTIPVEPQIRTKLIQMKYEMGKKSINGVISALLNICQKMENAK